MRRVVFFLILAGSFVALLSPPAEPQDVHPLQEEWDERNSEFLIPNSDFDRDPRSVMVLRFECTSALGRREVTLFGNGTVRLWDGPPGEEEMLLGELEPEELDGVLARLDEEDLSEAPAEYHGVEGEWVEECVLELPRRGEGGEELLGARPAPPDGSATTFRFSPYAPLPLALSRVVRIARELGEVAEEERALGLPPGYEPRRGDVLVRVDGERFRVVQFTDDGKGVELQGVDQPLTLYLEPEALGAVFEAVESRVPE